MHVRKELFSIKSIKLIFYNISFSDVKQRLQTKLGLVNQEYEKQWFSLFNDSKIISRCDDNIGRINVNELIPSRLQRFLEQSNKPITMNYLIHHIFLRH